MDYEEMRRAYESAKKTKESVQEYPDGWNPKEDFQKALRKHYMGEEDKQSYTPPPIEHDYSIIKMPNGNFVVARSHRLGSLDYEFICECVSHWEAKQIVRGLNK